MGHLLNTHVCMSEWFSPCYRAAGAVFSLRTCALHTGGITQVTQSMWTQVLSCRQRATVNNMTSHLPHLLSTITFPRKKNLFLLLCFYLFTSFVMFAQFFPIYC